MQNLKFIMIITIDRKLIWKIGLHGSMWHPFKIAIGKKYRSLYILGKAASVADWVLMSNICPNC